MASRVLLTRFAALGMVQDAPGLWRLVDLYGGHFNPATGTGGRVGPHYRTAAELVADLGRYAVVFGE